jgi:hypothetical protein
LVRRIVVALAIAALLPLPSLADEPQLEAVAVRALRWAFYASNGYRWEYSGILVIHDGQLRYSASPKTLKQVDAVEMDVEKQRTPGDTLVGLYHTHPCKSDEYFPQYFHRISSRHSSTMFQHSYSTSARAKYTNLIRCGTGQPTLGPWSGFYERTVPGPGSACLPEEW